jgi:hypothetical protein
MKHRCPSCAEGAKREDPGWETSPDGNGGGATSNGKGAPQKCTDHITASKRQQAHALKQVPTALPCT